MSYSRMRKARQLTSDCTSPVRDVVSNVLLERAFTLGFVSLSPIVEVHKSLNVSISSGDGKIERLTMALVVRHCLKLYVTCFTGGSGVCVLLPSNPRQTSCFIALIGLVLSTQKEQNEDDICCKRLIACATSRSVFGALFVWRATGAAAMHI